MKKIKVCILEFDYHVEVLRNTILILNDPRFDVKIFTTKEIWEKVDLNLENFQNRFENLIFDSTVQSFKTYLNYYLRTLNNSDIILFNTLASRYKDLISIKFNPTVVLRIHNSNAYFNRFLNTYRPKLTPFFIWKDISHFIRESILKLDWYHRGRFLKKVNYFAFPGKNISLYANQHFPQTREKSLVLPFSFWEKAVERKVKQEKNNFVISVIGKVDQRNRDYEMIYSAFYKLNSFLEKNNYNVKLIFLGASNNAYGKKIIKNFSLIKSENFQLISFEKFVNQNEFDKHISETDFLILPINIKTRYTIHQELYGKTKISGAINDVIKYQKPGLINSDYNLDDNLKACFESFNNEDDLSIKIKNWLSNKKYLEIEFSHTLEEQNLINIQDLYFKNFHDILNLTQKKN